MQIEIRRIRQDDLVEYKYWKSPGHRYHSLNGPYFKKKSTAEIEVEVNLIADAIREGEQDPLPNRRIISNENLELLGEVNWYWKSEETNWLEVGLVIFDERNWGKGIGSLALRQWIDVLFEEKPELVRIGLSTWSGNEGMMRLSEKLGLKKEAHYRQARIVEGIYYDSISYGILKEEWKGNTSNPD